MKTLILFIMAFKTNTTTLLVTSPSFNDQALIPSKYTCTGKSTNPELNIGNVPGSTQSLALIMDDPDAKGTFDHWIMWNIPPDGKISEDSAPGTQGRNGKGDSGYTGPCPPSGTHHYHFKAYALDAELELAAGSDKKALDKAMEGHIIGQGELIGLYKK